MGHSWATYCVECHAKELHRRHMVSHGAGWSAEAWLLLNDRARVTYRKMARAAERADRMAS